MSLLRINRHLINKSLKSQRFNSTASALNDEYTAVPNYPQILDISYEKKMERKKEAIYEEIKAVKTVEEKQIKLNMPKFYGFKCCVLNEDQIPYNNLNLAQHITRTHLIESSSLPEYYNEINVDTIVENLKGFIEDAIQIEYEGYKRRHEIKQEEMEKGDVENVLAASLIKQINRMIMNNLAANYKHILDTQIDYEPRIESFWYAGGMIPPENIKKYREGQEWRKHTKDDPVDRLIDYNGKPVLTLRNTLPLPPIIPHGEASNPDFKVPFFKYDPRAVGNTTSKHLHIANVPGYWAGDTHKFGAISYHNRGHMCAQRYGDAQDDKEALHRQGILASFGWLNAQANMLGFTTFNEITYPLVTQSVVTNGQIWSFYIYQLNTLLIHGKNATENPKCNICWTTGETKLFDEIENGKVKGLNDDVLKMIVKCYANAPAERLGVNFTPYLSQDVKIIADYKDDDKRNWLEREYKFLVANRPRYKLGYEIYHWEKIYKIDHKTRPMEARRRPFELFYKPSDRRLDARQANYIPRKLRPDLPKYKGRYAKEYFP